MTVEVKESVRKSISWCGYFAEFVNRDFCSISLSPKLEEIIADPEGFLAFAQAIYDELKANQPPKPRKERSDKGTHKSSATLLDGSKVLMPSG